MLDGKTHFRFLFFFHSPAISLSLLHTISSPVDDGTRKSGKQYGCTCNFLSLGPFTDDERSCIWLNGQVFQHLSSDSNSPFEMWYIFSETTLARSRMQKTFVFMLDGCLSFIFHSINMLIAFILRNSSSLMCVSVCEWSRENCIAFKILWLWKILKQMAFFVMCLCVYVKYPLIDSLKKTGFAFDYFQCVALCVVINQQKE